jgi:hypothetical protein
MPAAVNHTDINIETNCANRIELDVFNILRYCKISGTVINRRALRNLSPVMKKVTVNFIIQNTIKISCIMFWIKTSGLIL